MHTRTAATRRQREVDQGAARLVERLLELAPRGLAAAYLPDSAEFAQTVRGVAGSPTVRIRPEGVNPRYAAIAAMGLSRVPLEVQHDVLGGRTASEVAAMTAARVLGSTDPGAVALAAWAEAELTGSYPGRLLGRLRDLLSGGRPLPTVDTAWMLTAAVAADGLGPARDVLEPAAQRLLAHAGDQGTFPHLLPPQALPRWRAHVGCFADQVYPIQALARAAALTGESSWLAAANTTARMICGRQGREGQWWWHYDVRDGTVVEGFPVYSVHQHAMAPMALLDLLDAGGDDHRAEVARGVHWLDSHPEVVEELVSERWGLVWRKVARRERLKAARAAQAATSSVRAGNRLPGLDRILPPASVDHECRPYELGWLLYAWLDGGDLDD
ncbi:hypothetical protein [Nocardioides donggukensis]|uniref:Uncharacterized protein n=1 Tax=Nocardioides donggukensis TaxID=2774019 RepID=A0A927K4Q9_9ACTN|nr:hypothetical protein [Nocardioides donggukensis]MBD8870474.1 hypothetical protein [Nocardioides donggukensis]